MPTEADCLGCERLVSTAAAFAASSSGQEIALGSGNEVLVFQRRAGGGGSEWQQTACLGEAHEAAVSSLAWFASDEGGTEAKLASSGHDRNAFVFERQAAEASASGRGDDEESPWLAGELVVTKLSLAALALAVAPCGRKLALGSGDKLVSLCYWEESKRLWAPKLIRKRHQSAVMGVAFHPSGALLATVSADCRLRLLNGVVPAVDKGVAPPALGASRLGDALVEAPLPGWGLAAAFSPRGGALAAASQGGLTLLDGIDVRDPSTWEAAAATQQQLALPSLPLKALAFLSDSLLVGGGFDCRPQLFRRAADGTWAFARQLSGLRLQQRGGGGGAAAAKGKLAGRIHMFESHAAAAGATSGGSRAGGSGSGDGEASKEESGMHQSCIIGVQALPPAAGGPLRFLTASLDGRVAEWEVAAA
eukprot:scaffold20.g7732.t1